MGYDKELLTFLSNGANDEMSRKILSSLRTLHESQLAQTKARNSVRFLPNQDRSQRIKKVSDPTTKNKETLMRDRVRDRARRRHERDVDLRYMKTLRSLKEKLKSAYCNKRNCPTLRERRQLHNLERHSSAKRFCSPECITQTSDSQKRRLTLISPNPTQYMLSKSGTNFNNERFGETESSKRQVSKSTSLHDIKTFDCEQITVKNTNEANNQCNICDISHSTSKNMAGFCKIEDNQFVNTSQRTDGNENSADLFTIQSYDNINISNANYYLNSTENFNVADSCKIILNNPSNNDNVKCDKWDDEPTSKNIERCFDTDVESNNNGNINDQCNDSNDGPTTSKNIFKSNTQCNKIVDIRKITKKGEPSTFQCHNKISGNINDTHEVCDRPVNAGFVDNNKITVDKYNNNSMYNDENCDISTASYDIDSKGNIKSYNHFYGINSRSETCDDNLKKNLLDKNFRMCGGKHSINYKNSNDKVNNISRSRSPKTRPSECIQFHKTVDTQSGNKNYKSDIGNSCFGQCSNNSNFCNPMNRKTSFANKNHNTSAKMSSEKYYSVCKPCNSKSDDDVSFSKHIETLDISQPKITNDNTARWAVNEWFREIPMFPGLGKEAKEDNEKIKKSLIRTLYNLLAQSDNTEYEQKLKYEIDNCLERLPIWYPGAKKDRTNFKTYMIDRLLKKLTNISPQTVNKTNAKNLNSKAKSDKDTDISHGYANEIKNEIMQWLSSINWKTDNDDKIAINIEHYADFIFIRINPLIYNFMNNNIHKLTVVTAVVNILKNLPINVSCPSRKSLYEHRFARDLTNRLLSIRANYYNRCKNTNTPRTSNFCFKNNEATSSDEYGQKSIIICNAVRKCFEDGNIDCSNLVIEETGLLINDFVEMPDPEGEKNVKNEMINLLVTSTNLSEAQASGIAKTVLRKVKILIAEGRINTRCHKFQQSMNISVYTSIEECSPMNYPITSTPKKKRGKKNISKLNSEEIEYLKKLSNLIRAWMETLPVKFNSPDERDFKETIIKNLANDIMDHAKMEQLTSKNQNDRKKYNDYFVRRWIWRINAFEIEEAETEIEILVNKIEDIPVPVLTKPRHGNRQEMENIKLRKENWDKPFLPKGSDILENEISIWMNEQPSYIFNSTEQDSRSKKIHEFAQVLESKLKSKLPVTELTNEVAKWLYSIVKPQNVHEIPELTENLKERVIRLPQDATLATNLAMKLNSEAEIKREKEKYMIAKEKRPNRTNNSSKDDPAEQEHTMKMFLSKYIENKYDIDDPLARRAFNRLLKTHLQSLSPQTRQEVYNNLGKSESNEKFPPLKLIKELEYIKDISDWLKNLPIDASYNILGNRDRIDFVNNLAMNIREIEEERDHDPNAMNFNLYMASIIHECLRQLPILSEYVNIHNYDFMTNQLLDKIEAHRQNVLNKTKMNESIDTTGVNTDNIGDIIEEFIEINGDDIAQDEVKLEAWAIRLIREIKKMVQVTSQPSVLSKAHIYRKLCTVPKPGDGTADLFRLELEYVKEISSWLKNLPLLSINEEEEENKRVSKICELAEKMTDIDQKKTISPNDKSIDKEFEEYVTKWISELPLDERRDIVLPIVIKQLIKRMEKVKHGDTFSSLKFTPLNNKNAKSSNYKQSSSCKPQVKGNKHENVYNVMINVIEKWVNALPFKDVDKEATQNIKDAISRKLLQKVGQLSTDARIINDDLMYQHILADEIDTIFESISGNPTLKNNKAKLKNDILSSIIEAKNMIKEKSAGDTYKLKLENTIEASIPHPVNVNYIYDPGFEMYKNRLATMFILDNFDHGSDIVKLKYENLLKKEIDRYFEHANNKNAVPLSKDVIYNELYSVLFKVPIPNEAAIIEEVEELKTRCEIDAWFEKLPLREPDGLSELLEWDKILSTLAKKIHTIETTESNPDQIIFKEIVKWLVKLPIQPGHENELEQYAENLQTTLKSTALDRKCIPDNSKTIKSKKDKAKEKGKQLAKVRKEESQIAGLITRDQTWKSSKQNTPQIRNTRKKASDEIFEIVQNWCNQLPVGANTSSEQFDTQMLKDNLTTNIIIKISELNMNPTIFNNDDQYEELLDNELEKLLLTIPLTRELENSKAARKYQLKEALKSIKPHILEERAYHLYKKDLNRTVDKILDKPHNISPENDDTFVEIKNDIIDNFVQYNYFKDDDKSRQTHKNNLHNSVTKFVDIVDKNNRDKINTLMKANQLVSELAKVPTTSRTNDRNEVEEIRMKNEIADFLHELGLERKDVNKSKVNYLKSNLAKKLNEIEIEGYTPKNEQKMKYEVARCLNKLGKQVDPAVIDTFINRLKNNEHVRRAPQMLNEDDGQVPNGCQKVCKRICHSGNQGLETEFSSVQFPASLNLLNVPEVPFRLEETDSLAFGPQNSEAVTNPHAIAREQRNGEREVSGAYKSGSPEEKERSLKCPCDRRSYKGCRSRPVCMVPMPWICEGCDGHNSFWCRMPLPGFF